MTDEGPIYCAFATPEYDEELTELIGTLREHNLPYYTQTHACRGSWDANTRIIAEFCLEMLDLHHPRPIVYLDADARVRKDPELWKDWHKGDPPDIALHYRKDHVGQRLAPIPGEGELLNGTMYFTNNGFNRVILEQWIALNEFDTKIWEQKNLQKIIYKNKARINLIDLPPEYCAIDSMRVEPDKVVIEHTQASRKFRGLIK